MSGVNNNAGDFKDPGFSRARRAIEETNKGELNQLGVRFNWSRVIASEAKSLSVEASSRKMFLSILIGLLQTNTNVDYTLSPATKEHLKASSSEVISSSTNSLVNEEAYKDIIVKYDMILHDIINNLQADKEKDAKDTKGSIDNNIPEPSLYGTEAENENSAEITEEAHLLTEIPRGKNRISTGVPQDPTVIHRQNLVAEEMKTKVTNLNKARSSAILAASNADVESTNTQTTPAPAGKDVSINTNSNVSAEAIAPPVTPLSTPNDMQLREDAVISPSSVTLPPAPAALNASSSLSESRRAFENETMQRLRETFNLLPNSIPWPPEKFDGNSQLLEVEARNAVIFALLVSKSIKARDEKGFTFDKNLRKIFNQVTALSAQSRQLIANKYMTTNDNTDALNRIITEADNAVNNYILIKTQKTEKITNTPTVGLKDEIKVTPLDNLIPLKEKEQNLENAFRDEVETSE